MYLHVLICVFIMSFDIPKQMFISILDCSSSLYCKNGGTCSSINGGTEHSCNCADGWMGSNCEQVGKFIHRNQRVKSLEYFIALSQKKE
jgi:hypothetical protein